MRHRDDESLATPPTHGDGMLVLVAVFVLAICGLIYELIAGTLSSYLLGDSVTQFSLVIGLFLSAMGIGSYLSKFITSQLVAWFIGVEVAVGIVGGFTAMIGFVCFTFTELYLPVLLSLVVLVGTLIGMEIPLIIRILRQQSTLRVTLANVLSVDYLGALAASVMFPFLLVPHVGLVRGGLLTGMANVAVGGLLLWRLGYLVGPKAKTLLGTAIGVSAIGMAAGIIYANALVTAMETRIYSNGDNEVILVKQSPMQRIVVTHWRDDVRLYLNGHLQFSTIDEYRYHEALVLPAMNLAPQPTDVLVLGGGDGLAVQRVLQFPTVKRVDLVDIDKVVTDLFSKHEVLSRISNQSLRDPRVAVHNTDAMKFLQSADDLYDVIIMDLPDPSEPALGKLYSRPFFGLVGNHLKPDGVLVTQATSPYRSRDAFWCIKHTIESPSWGPAGEKQFRAFAYHTQVPTFGMWGFVIARATPFTPEDIQLSSPGKYLTNSLLPSLFVFPADMAEVPTEVSQLDNPRVVHLYRRGYHKYLE